MVSSSFFTAIMFEAASEEAKWSTPWSRPPGSGRGCQDTLFVAVVFEAVMFGAVILEAVMFKAVMFEAVMFEVVMFEVPYPI